MWAQRWGFPKSWGYPAKPSKLDHYVSTEAHEMRWKICDLTSNNYFLRMIASLTHYSDIVSDIPSGCTYGIYTLTLSLTSDMGASGPQPRAPDLGGSAHGSWQVVDGSWMWLSMDRRTWLYIYAIGYIFQQDFNDRKICPRHWKKCHQCR